jgi:8-oxo-dGTP pyrophosphatase MutT (NUDIX family)
MSAKKIKQKVQIVVSTNDAILLLKLNEDRGGFWQNATGSVEKNEKFLEAAKRELLEETGIRSPLDELPMEIKFHDRWGFDVVEKIFHCKLSKQNKIKISEEHQDYKWLPYKNLKSTDYEYENHFKAAILAKGKLG